MQSKKKRKVGMQILDQYKIQFSGLKNGQYHFDFEITNSFFELKASPDVQRGDLSVSVNLDKQENMMIFSVSHRRYRRINVRSLLGVLSLSADN